VIAPAVNRLAGAIFGDDETTLAPEPLIAAAAKAVRLEAKPLGHRLGDGDHQQSGEYGHDQDDVDHAAREFIGPLRGGEIGALCPAFRRSRQPFSCGRCFGSYGQRSTSTQTLHKGLRAIQT
jgi:hypothetical protein